MKTDTQLVIIRVKFAIHVQYMYTAMAHKLHVKIIVLPYMGKFWQTIQVKPIGEEKFGKGATVSAYPKYIFGVFVNIGEENFGMIC